MSGLAIKTESPCGVRVAAVEAELHELVEDIDDRTGRELAIFSNGFEGVKMWVNDWN